jgi:teichuronic acid biosynthesis glycosyltransferase TuaG
MSKYVSDLVSIITPAYCVDSIIMETIDSVIKQTYKNWEMLIADDCSLDGTVEVVARAAKTDPRIRLLCCQRNGGPAEARNMALSHAKGRWIAFLDSDDIWMPTKLQETIEFARDKNSALTFTGFRRISSDNKLLGHYVDVPNSLNYRQLLSNTAIATSTVLIDRDLVGELKMQKVYYDDFVCWLGILKRDFIAYGLRKDLMHYRVVSGSVSRNKRKSAFEVWRIYRDFEKLNLMYAAWSFLGYALRALKKYRNF